MTTSEPNARRYSRRCRQRRMARRRNAMVIMAILAVLATVFALGYASGCSARQTDDEVKTPEPVVTAETVTPPAPEQSPVEPSAPPEETTEPARHRDDIVSEGRLLSYELQEVMQDCCEHYEVPYALALAIAEVETQDVYKRQRLGSYFSAAITISCGKAASIRIRSISESVLGLRS